MIDSEWIVGRGAKCSWGRSSCREGGSGCSVDAGRVICSQVRKRDGNRGGGGAREGGGGGGGEGGGGERGVEGRVRENWELFSQDQPRALAKQYLSPLE